MNENRPNIENFTRDWTSGKYSQGGQFEVAADPQAEVMKLFGGNMGKYNEWYNNLRPEDRPNNWENALMQVRSTSTGADAFAPGQIRTNDGPAYQPIAQVPQQGGGLLGQLMQRADYAGAGMRQKLGQVFGGNEQAPPQMAQVPQNQMEPSYRAPMNYQPTQMPNSALLGQIMSWMSPNSKAPKVGG